MTKETLKTKLMSLLQDAPDSLTKKDVLELVKTACATMKKKQKDPNMPVGARTAFILFSMDKRADAKKQLGADAKQTEITKLVGEMWSKKRDSKHKDIDKYNKLALKDKERYKKEMEEYKSKQEAIA